MKLNIYVLRRIDGTKGPYDSYDCHVVAETSYKKARELCPEGHEGNTIENGARIKGEGFWLDPKRSECFLIGSTETYQESIVICSSYNAG